jgi:uncharacterized protein
MPRNTGLIQPVNLPLPRLPAALEGFRIAHITDLHAHRPRRRFTRAGDLLINQRVDVVVLTGDYMDRRDHQEGAVAALAKLCQRLRPRVGVFGVFGNHDAPEFRRLCEPLGVTWLSNRVYRHASLPLEIVGLDTTTAQNVDTVSLLLDPSWSAANGRAEDRGPDARRRADRPLRVMLSHLPSTLVIASDLDADLMLAGHTHGGQIRPWGRPLANSMHWPLRLTTGILRHRQTIACISRGLGETGLIPLRLLCPPHVPLYTLRRGGLPGPTGDAITRVRGW